MQTKEESYNICHDFTIKADVQKVYEAITKPEHLVNWWPLKCSGTPKMDEEYNFFFDVKYDWYGKVIKVVENSSFHINMTKSDDNWNSTSFGFDLFPKEKFIVVKFSHKGWPHCNDEYRQSSYCWAILLNGLKNYVEKGVIIPFEDRE